MDLETSRMGLMKNFHLVDGKVLYMIICDTREKENQRILQYFETNHIPYIEQKLDTGDYINPDKKNIVIERKKDLGELLKNMCSSDKIRFQDEIRRAHEAGIRFIVLCEHGGQYKTIKDVVNYKSRYSKIPGRVLMERMYAAHIAYGVEFLFCDKRSTGRKIVELLEV